MQFVLNYEEGAENHVLHGDAGSEQFLSDIIGAASYPARHMMDSLYGTAVGPGSGASIANSASGAAADGFRRGDGAGASSEIVAAIKAADYDVVSHGWRWITISTWISPGASICKAVQVLTRTCSASRLGWYTGRDGPNTRHWWWSGGL
ncbi:hypothetical protein [Klebsiella pneumoniae]|uniref:hypothetical protein n=1 Tax=Klebsiella pneumoniae TaxID=573 RepID=UPI001390218B|nr:hypothetical protein [Klebsiella pneumoniae]